MNLSMSDPDDRRREPDDRRREPDRKPEKTFEELLRDLQPKLDAIPNEMRIPALPPSENSAAEVQNYVRETMGLPVATDVPNWVFVGNESIERSKIREGRLGMLDDLYIFAFLYPYEKTLHTVCIYPRDGIDPRMIAKAVLWGQVHEIPNTIAHSHIMDAATFFSLKCVDFKKLVDAQLLEKARSDWQDYFGKESRELERRLSLANLRVKEIETERTVATQEHQKREKELTELWQGYNLSAEIWKLVAWVFGVAFSLVALRLYFRG